MPFDNTTTTPGLDTAAGRRTALLWHLRYDPDTRDNWNFGHCRTCAIGVCWRLGFSTIDLGFDQASAYELFMSTLYYGVNHSLVTPDMVADAIEAEAEIRNL